MDNKIKRSKVEILKYLEDVNIGQSLDENVLESIAESLSGLSNTFKLEDPKEYTKLITNIAGGLRLTSEADIDKMVKYLTGHSMDEIQNAFKSKNESELDDDNAPEVTEELEQEEEIEEEPIEPSHTDVLEGDVVGLPGENKTKVNIRQGMKNLYNKAADTSMVDMTITNFYRAINVYDMVRGTNTLGNIVKKTLIGATALTATTVGVAAITTLRLARFGAKTFRAAKGWLAEVVHNKAIKDIVKVQKGLQVQKNNLGKELEERESNVDKKAAELGFIGADGKATDSVYKTLAESRKNGEISIEACEDVIAGRYDEVSQKRDADLMRVSNGVGIHILQKHFGITEKQAMYVIENLTCSSDGKIECENLDFSGLTEQQVKILKNSAKRQIRIGQISENDKMEAMKYVQVVNGIIMVKEGENIDKLPRDVQTMLNYLRNRKATKEDIDRINAGNNEISFLAMCEQELLGRVAIKANEDMAQEFEQKKVKVKSEQRGFLKSVGEKIVGMDLRARAKAIVAQREEKFINDSIRRNEGASERLATLARERLQTRINEDVDRSNSRTIEDDEHSI